MPRPLRIEEAVRLARREEAQGRPVRAARAWNEAAEQGHVGAQLALANWHDSRRRHRSARRGIRRWRGS